MWMNQTAKIVRFVSIFFPGIIPSSKGATNVVTFTLIEV